MGDVNGGEPETKPNQQTPIRPVATEETEINRELRPTRQTDGEEEIADREDGEEEEEDYLDEMRREIEEERRQKERQNTEPNAEEEGLSQ